MASEELRSVGSINNKVVMVTGASSGIGLELCLDLAKAGCLVVAAARRIDRLRSLCDNINRTAASSSSPSSVEVRAVAVELDISADAPVVETSVKRAWSAFGRIDALVNNAGVRGNVNSPLDLPEEEWHKVMSTNLTGTWLVTKYICRLMRDAKQKGSVINISSIAGVNRGQLPGGLAYAVTKAGVNTMTQRATNISNCLRCSKCVLLSTNVRCVPDVCTVRTRIPLIQSCQHFKLFTRWQNVCCSPTMEVVCQVMALELGQYNIRVNSISPGLFKSEITVGLVEKEWLKRVNMKIIPLKDNGTTDPALTSVVRYLIDDSSEYVSGNSFIVDAGVTLPGIPIFSSL